jgi:hypothetical protein
MKRVAAVQIGLQTACTAGCTVTMLQRVHESALRFVQHVHAVGAAAVHKKQPFVHILLSPTVPLVKYVLPVGIIFAFGHWAAVDAMFIRMMADEDARLRHLADRSQQTAAPDTAK